MMMKMNLRNVVVLVLGLNALFWGLLPHSVHCKTVAMVSNMKCPTHSVHLMMGVVFYFLAVYVRQQKYIMSK